MDERQQELLTLVVEKYITTAEPVGSKFLVDSASLDWSEATVRNELRVLEEAGYLTHPHTSAGRIPTTLGYRFYLQQLPLASARISKQDGLSLDKAIGSTKDYEQERKQLAKVLVELAEETVLIAFTTERFYYTGLAYLFQKPDFAEMRLVASVSQVFDRCEEYLPRFFSSVEAEPRYFLGAEHPFGEMLSVLALRFGKKSESLLALVGPQRMNYRRNWGLIQKVKELL